MIFVDTQTEEKRYNICKSCEKFSHAFYLCTVCKCFMPGKVKMIASECPLQKW